MKNSEVLPFVRLAEQFEKLPGIGKKSAQRMAYHILNQPKEKVEEFAKCLVEAKQKIVYCDVCKNITDRPVCTVCGDEARDRSTILVVESPRDVTAFERTREYNGLYHVLHGLISPMDGIGPESLYIKELIARMGDGEVKEVIMATNPTVEGEATAMYISRLLKPMGVTVTRLAYGIPVGGHLEYTDDVTLYRALEGRSVL
ncbi:MAG: recombination protein RecR [Oscillospiraceae bacterium]|nr:recombination protein RecR [Oscillospiraceae bacterium]MBQ3048459.1 recombination protein RecR [Oscillospiraceae bacterium]MBQ9939320.1 recombination protein RecR [Oscillospiraceae bacterium]